jgi:hypothetical protein
LNGNLILLDSPRGALDTDQEPLRNDETLVEGILLAGEFYKRLGVASVRFTLTTEESINDTHRC